jgi:N-acetylglutamate synthase-like GNAT family acetyltransferase
LIRKNAADAPSQTTATPQPPRLQLDQLSIHPGQTLIAQNAHVPATAEAAAVTIATAADLSFVLDLQRRFANALGFLPRQAVEEYVRRGRIFIAQDNNQEAGFVLSAQRLRCAPHVQPITQTAIAFDAQRRHLGRSLIDHLAAEALNGGRSMLQAWCRANLEANHFWQSLGFTAVGVRRPLTVRKQPLILWRLPLNDHGRRMLPLLPTAAGYRARTTDPRRLLTAADRANLLPPAAA